MEYTNIHYDVIHAIAEFKVLTSPSYYKKTKLLKSFFQKEEHADALKNKEFISVLAQSLQEITLNKKVYTVIAEFYDLYHTDVVNADSEFVLLYEEVSKKIRLNLKPHLFELLLIPIFAVLPFTLHIFDITLNGDDMFVVLFSFLSFVLGCTYIYKLSRRKCSRIGSQIITLIYADLLLFFIYTFQIWSSAFIDQENALYFLVYFLIFSCAWIMILVSFTCIRKIINSIHKKTKGL